MKKYQWRIFFILLSLFNLKSLNAAAKEPFAFGAISEVCGQEGAKNREMCAQSTSILKKFTEELSHKSHVPLKLQVYTRVNEAVQLFEKEEIDCGYIKLIPFLKLKKRMGDSIEALALSTQSNGSDTYYSAFVTLNEKKNVHWDDLQGKTIGFIRDSASGYYLPKVVLKEKKLLDSITVKMYDNYYDVVDALKRKEIFGLFGADVAFPGGALGDPDLFKIQFFITDKLPQALFVVNTDKIDPKERRALKRQLAKISVPFNGEGINTFSGFKPIKRNQHKLLQDIAEILED